MQGMDRPPTATDGDVAPESDPTETTRPRRRFRRSTTDRDVAGVVGGAAELTGVDSSVLRLVVVGLTTFLAFGVEGGAQLLVVLPYALAWAIVPTEGARPLLRQLPRRAAAQELGLMGALVVITSWAVDQPNVLLVAVLGGAAALLLRDRPDTDRPDSDRPDVGRPGDDRLEPAGRPGAADPALRHLGGSGTAEASDGTERLTATSTAAVRQRGPRRSRPDPRMKREPALWPLALGLVLVVLFGAAAVAVLFGAAAVAQVNGGTADPRLVVNLLLLVVGGVMVLSAWRGRARVLILACPLLLPVWFATSAADIGGQEGTGIHRHRPSEVPSSGSLAYEVGTGAVDVDLTDLPFDPGSTTHLEVAVTLGVARVVVPEDVELEISGELGLGRVNVEGRNMWRSDTWAAHRTVKRSDQPEPPPCYPTQVTETDLRDLLVTHGSPASHSDDLAEAVARAGFERPQVVGSIPGFHDGFGDPGHDDGFGPAMPDQDMFEVYLSPWWELCTPSPPDPNPPVLVIDATIGLGSLEVRRV